MGDFDVQILPEIMSISVEPDQLSQALPPEYAGNSTSDTYSEANPSHPTYFVGWSLAHPNPFTYGDTILTHNETMEGLIMGGIQLLHDPSLSWKLVPLYLGGVFFLELGRGLAHEASHSLAYNRYISEAFGFPETLTFSYHTFGFEDWHGAIPTGGSQYTDRLRQLRARVGSEALGDTEYINSNLQAGSGINTDNLTSSKSLERVYIRQEDPNFFVLHTETFTHLRNLYYAIYAESHDDYWYTDPGLYMLSLRLKGDPNIIPELEYFVAQYAMRNVLDFNLWFGLYNFYFYATDARLDAKRPEIGIGPLFVSAPAVELYLQENGFFYNFTPYVRSKNFPLTTALSIGTLINFKPYLTENEWLNLDCNEQISGVPNRSITDCERSQRGDFNEQYARYHLEVPRNRLRGAFKIFWNPGATDQWYAPTYASLAFALALNETNEGNQLGGMVEGEVHLQPLSWTNIPVVEGFEVQASGGYAEGDVVKNLAALIPKGPFYDLKAGFTFPF